VAIVYENKKGITGLSKSSAMISEEKTNNENKQPFVAKDVISENEDHRDNDEVLSSYIVKLVKNYSQDIIVSQRHYTPIHVDEIASRLAMLYEKLRKIIDWKDDNALRRGAIERVLKRILFPNLAGFKANKASSTELAETITVELIRGGHLPNDTIPMERMDDIGTVLNKYLIFLETVSDYDFFAVKQKINYTNFILETAACEIEEVLTNPVKEYGIINAMTFLLQERIKFIPNDFLEKEEIRKYIFIATIKTLYDLDDRFIAYALLRRRFADWNESDEKVKRIAKELPEAWKDVENDLNKPFLRKFLRVAERVDTIFMLIDDILTNFKNKPEKLMVSFEDPEKFAKLIKKAYEKRYATLKTRLFRLAIFSTLSVFLSNWVTFYVVEVPMAKIFYEGFNFRTAAIDFIVPTALMFVLVSMIRLPRKRNLDKVIVFAFSFIYKDEDKHNFQLRFDSKRPSLMKIVMTSLYFEMIIVVFAGIAYLFYIAGLPITSVIFDTFTISITVFAAVAIKNKSKELNVDEETSIGDFFLDMLSVPIAKVGSIFAKKWKEYNVIAMLFNFLIETPFAVILNVIQGWSDFISERKQELH